MHAARLTVTVTCVMPIDSSVPSFIVILNKGFSFLFSTNAHDSPHHGVNLRPRHLIRSQLSKRCASCCQTIRNSLKTISIVYF